MKLRYLIVLLSLVGHNNLMASTQDYKCYVQLTNQSYQIAFVDGSNVQSTAQASQLLLTQGFYAEDGQKLLKVAKVVECQKMHVSFIDNKANLADERTPR
ncbi:TapY2 family type IVa secretion system protein [Catenovulum sp. SX2]|uniref:TapY2 family type IVa secretion system protein n=1 Tax=Catenovulum sp. SX2 TaxID=3398614 RepID=UPI003F83AD8F